MGAVGMTDIFDQASEREQADRDAAISATLERIKASRLQPVGSCHNCGERVCNVRLFCDADCSADHELRTRSRR